MRFGFTKKKEFKIGWKEVWKRFTTSCRPFAFMTMTDFNVNTQKLPFTGVREIFRCDEKFLFNFYTKVEFPLVIKILRETLKEKGGSSSQIYN